MNQSDNDSMIKFSHAVLLIIIDKNNIYLIVVVIVAVEKWISRLIVAIVKVPLPQAMWKTLWIT
jgi:hypothetical protein